MDICLICLRTDRLLKLASNVLEEFHEELCDFSVVTMACPYYYCNECEYILTKFYEFKQKCVKAMEVYQKWLSTKASKKLAKSNLYTELPPTTITMWVPDSEVSSYTLQPSDSQTDLNIEDALMKDTYPKEVKIEQDQIDLVDNSEFSDALKVEYNSDEATKSERFDDAKNESEPESYTGSLYIDTDKETGKHESDVSSRSKRKKERTDDTDSKESKHESESSKGTRRKREKKEIDYLEQLYDDTDTKDSKHESDVSKGSKRKKATKKIAKRESKEPVTKAQKHSDAVLSKREARDEKIKEENKIYSKVFDIEYLTTREMMLEEFARRKTYECYVKASHKCEICYQVFKSSKFVEYHTKKWHTESAGTVYCAICKIWNSRLSNHKLTHTMVFKCKLCPLVTYHRDSMINHYEWHEGKQYRCEECNITCKSKSVYRTHMGKVHRRGRHVCPQCGRGFRSPIGLAIHRSSSSRCTAPQEAPGAAVRCDECDVTLPSQEVYEAHLVDVHRAGRYNSGLPYTVDSAGLPELRMLKSHPQRSRIVKRVRPPPVRNTCRVCHKVGTSFGWLHLHFKREHPNADLNVLYADKKKHLCDICGNGFSNVYALRDHMNIHTGARPHACDICPKKFRTAYLMRAHRVRHFPSTLPCMYCGKTFKTTGNLQWHMKVHTGEKNHKCEICGKAFLYAVNMNEHVRAVHYNIRRDKRGAREGADATKRGRTLEINEYEDSNESDLPRTV